MVNSDEFTEADRERLRESVGYLGLLRTVDESEPDVWMAGAGDISLGSSAHERREYPFINDTRRRHVPRRGRKQIVTKLENVERVWRERQLHTLEMILHFEWRIAHVWSIDQAVERPLVSSNE